MELSKSQEDYLKIIWYMERDQIKATAKAVADWYQVKPPTVLSMFKQLSQMELIEYDKTKGALLLEKGDFLARKLIRKHRLVETFLEKVLKMDDQILHEEAEKLEHAISDKLMYLIDAFLGFPDKDPHGSPIPNWGEHLKAIQLKNVIIGHSFRVQDIQLTAELEQYYTARQFAKGTTWTLQDKTPDNSVYTLTNGKAFLAVSGTIVSSIKVIPHY
ncbi:MAG: metal-dependent transcriptional regulator [Calditrichaeota bacterium]|nr:metal-dependent transcriptional regulator [Calditrichota bacterium]MCB0267566.1 metal-dependent transcriptional regulator [Calditrichota bacterium]MCB0285655.1 metal-dependent transcriptional regulator [Calditrichota bacterium]MCB0299230.1 metal-dependent transcriptional regulator [Calditrichota bacterium]MCB9068887.1 metal-dependent transcriptional regulator [Calditrichia bacterium]